MQEAKSAATETSSLFGSRLDVRRECAIERDTLHPPPGATSGSDVSATGRERLSIDVEIRLSPQSAALASMPNRTHCADRAFAWSRIRLEGRHSHPSPLCCCPHFSTMTVFFGTTPNRSVLRAAVPDVSSPVRSLLAKKVLKPSPCARACPRARWLSACEPLYSIVLSPVCGEIRASRQQVRKPRGTGKQQKGASPAPRPRMVCIRHYSTVYKSRCCRESEPGRASVCWMNCAPALVSVRSL